MLHFAEEYVTGFYQAFPVLFGGQAYSVNTFVVFNMCAYCLFLIGGIILHQQKRALMMMPLFFISYGVLGNAISHLAFSLMVQGYFPGLYTSFAYWVLAPLLIKSLWQETR